MLQSMGSQTVKHHLATEQQRRYGKAPRSTLCSFSYMLYKDSEPFLKEFRHGLEETELTHKKLSIKFSLKELQGSAEHCWITVLRLPRIHEWSSNFISSLLRIAHGFPFLDDLNLFTESIILDIQMLGGIRK